MKKKIVLIICLVIFIFSGMKIMNYLNNNRQESNIKEKVEKKIEKTEDIKIPISIDIKELQKENNDIIAYIYIPNTNISYPIVQQDNNEYYLNHDIEHNESIWGSIFLDKKAKADFSDKNSFIYGHSGLDSNKMFSDVKKYKDYDFFLNNHKGYLFTEKEIYLIDIYSMYQSDTDDKSYYNFVDNKEDFSNFIDMTYNHSFNKINNKPDIHDKLITLSTCSFEDNGKPSDLRYLLHAKIEKIKEL